MLGARGDLPAGVAVMRALAAGESAGAVLAALRSVEAECGPASGMAALVTDANHALVRDVLAMADHASGAGPSTWATVFDRAAERSPEGAVALYTLGDASALAAATAEVVDWLAAQKLLGPAKRVLEIGCGIGRFLDPLAQACDFVIGLDVSAAMCAEARRRSGPDVGVFRTSGRDLAALGNATFDLVLAIDSFPYLVGAGLADGHLLECARVLRPDGTLVILNYAYDGAEPRAPDELAAAAGERRPFRLWDGAAYRFDRRPA